MNSSLTRANLIRKKVFGITFSLTGGALQELVAVDTKTSLVVKKPQDWSWEQAAALPLVWLTGNSHSSVPFLAPSHFPSPPRKELKLQSTITA